MKKTLFVVLILIAPIVATAEEAEAKRRDPSGVTISILSAPRAFKGHGKQNLAWEMVINNDRDEAITLQLLEISSPYDLSLRAGYSARMLRPMMVNVPLRDPATDPAPEIIRSKELAIVYLWMTRSDVDDLPFALTQRVRFKSSRGSEVVNVPLMRVRIDQPVVISSPLRESPWYAFAGPSNESPHRRALLPINGKFKDAQRYAIDWLMIDPNGESYSGDPLQNRSYYSYGRDVLAVADGVVSLTFDGVPDNVPGETGKDLTLETLCGNYVVLDIGGGRYAVYAHLQPGSLKVKVGDRVTRGQSLALLGNSGNSYQPHLHFHLCDANSALDCDGLPYALTQFEELNWGTRNYEIPMDNDIILDFGQ